MWEVPSHSSGHRTASRLQGLHFILALTPPRRAVPLKSNVGSTGNFGLVLMTLLYLIRHGENIDGKVEGVGPTVDLGLSEVGRDQVERLCKRLASSSVIKPTALLASTERRAAETAQLLAPVLGLAVTPSRDLEEWRSDDGNIEPEQFMAQWRALKERDRAFHRLQPQSETQSEFSVRVGAALHAVSQQHEDGSMLLVTHGGFIQSAFRHFFGFGDAAFRRAYPAATHTSITHWRTEQGSDRWILEFANDARHLDGAANRVAGSC